MLTVDKGHVSSRDELAQSAEGYELLRRFYIGGDDWWPRHRRCAPERPLHRRGEADDARPEAPRGFIGRPRNFAPRRNARRSGTTTTRTTASGRSSSTRPTSRCTGLTITSCSRPTEASREPVATVPEATGRTGTLAISGVVNHRSIGVGRYARSWRPRSPTKTSAYGLVEQRDPVRPAHVHLANSSRSLLRQSRRPGPPSSSRCTTSSRGRARSPPRIAHSPIRKSRAWRRGGGSHGLGGGHAGARCRATASARGRPASGTPRRVTEGPLAARRALGWPDDRLIAVIPGVIKDVKLVAEALTAGERRPAGRCARRPSRGSGARA